MAQRLIQRLLKIERQLHFDERTALNLSDHDESPRLRKHYESIRETRRQFVRLKDDVIAGRFPNG